MTSLYRVCKPSIVVTHEAPGEIVDRISNPNVLRNFGYDPDKFTTLTQDALQNCFEAHQPDIWIHGHHHKSYTMNVNGTKFVGLAELEVYKI